MAQTTNFWGFVSGGSTVRVEYNTNGGSTFTDASGEIVSWSFGAGDRAVGELNTVDGDQPIVTVGKLSATDVTVRGVYTGASSGFWYDANQAYQNGTALYLRYYPAGSAAGRWRWSSGTNAVGSAASATGGACYVVGRPVANLDATASGDPFTYEVTVRAAGFTGGSL